MKGEVNFEPGEALNQIEEVIKNADSVHQTCSES